MKWHLMSGTDRPEYGQQVLVTVCPETVIGPDGYAVANKDRVVQAWFYYPGMWMRRDDIVAWAEIPEPWGGSDE